MENTKSRITMFNKMKGAKEDMDIGLKTKQLYTLKELKEDFKLERHIYDPKNNHSLFVDSEYKQGHFFKHKIPEGKKKFKYEYICQTL